MFNFRFGRMAYAVAAATALLFSRISARVAIEAKARRIGLQSGRPMLPAEAYRHNRGRGKRPRSAVSLRRRALKAGARRSARKRRNARKVA